MQSVGTFVCPTAIRLQTKSLERPFMHTLIKLNNWIDIARAKLLL